MKPYKLILILSVISVLFSCTKKDPYTIPQSETEIVNDFVYSTTTTYYLWESQIHTGINYLEYTDSYQLFDDLKNTELDHWSFLHDDYQVVLNSFNGIDKTAGYKMKLFQYEGSNDVFGIVEYVYKDGPAYNVGLKRGDYLLKINGQTLNTDNYIDLLSYDQYTATIGENIDNQIIETNTVSITTVEMTINPVLDYKVIDVSGTKIGYLLYDQFIEDYFTDLENVFIYFKAQGVTELILDLRYNPGGYVTTCSKLASMIAPASAIGDVFITEQWNDLLTDYLASNYGENSEYFIDYFPTPNVNLNLSRIAILTSNRTASASEAIINGLEPYMEVKIIGDTTAGKYTGASLFYDDVEYKHTWGLYLVINKIANAVGNTDFVNGFAPDIAVQDDYSTPVGDVDEVLTATAISYLTGGLTKDYKSKFINLNSFNFYQNKFEREGLMIQNKIKK
ncbi:MAG: hypothetical protein JXR51_00740 [Bacteroidales bacterium]|nr:hypothetical protein [Bacteroidales bacterium]MBN2755668.1 hypothetical protein [Bacteroidales bacterium]